MEAAVARGGVRARIVAAAPVADEGAVLGEPAGEAEREAVAELAVRAGGDARRLEREPLGVAVGVEVAAAEAAGHPEAPGLQPRPLQAVEAPDQVRHLRLREHFRDRGLRLH
jgi:hypothetical protein